jgi:hypothetical protein
VRGRAALLALAVLAAGCGEEAARSAARDAVGRMAKPTGEVSCTGGRTGYFGGGPPATVFICAVHVGGACDRYLARRRDNVFTVRLQARDTDCTLPSS